jgi:ATP-dependent helicase STH1/SNF2
LPECYCNDESFDVKEIDEELEGRGHRKHTVISYNDSLDDDTWAMVSTCLRSLQPEY